MSAPTTSTSRQAAVPYQAAAPHEPDVPQEPATDLSSEPAAPRPPVEPVAGRIGILGGTFDPIHIGHLAVAEEAREALGLERVLFVPAGHPWQKAARSVTRVEDRVAMVALAIGDAPAFALSRIEADRAGPSYAAETVRQLAAELTSNGATPDLRFILSSGSLLGLPTWHEPDRLLAACRLVVAPRPGCPAVGPAWLEAHLPSAVGRVTFLDGPRLDVSSSAIRARVAARRSIRYLVPDAVVAYIGDHGLYTRGREEDHRS